jgi:hypothetical protein
MHPLQAPNWLAKLGVVKKELVDEAERARPDVPELAAGYVYLQVCCAVLSSLAELCVSTKVVRTTPAFFSSPVACRKCCADMPWR